MSVWPLLGMIAGKLVVMAPQRPGLHTPKMSQFSRLYNNHSSERHKHGKGERSCTLLTGISLQSKVGGSRLSRRVHTDMG